MMKLLKVCYTFQQKVFRYITTNGITIEFTEGEFHCYINKQLKIKQKEYIYSNNKNAFCNFNDRMT
jgi:thiamine pyrophosphokinase